MCRPADCSTCQKKTWFGCGMHIPTVLDATPKEEWCTCVPKKLVGETEYPPKVGTGEAAK